MKKTAENRKQRAEYERNRFWVHSLRSVFCSLPSYAGLIVFSLTSVMMASGCGPVAKPQPVNLSSPKSAAIAYVTALQHGDAATARAASMGSEEQMKWVDALAAMVDGMRQTNQSVYDRFGGITNQFHTDLEESLRTLADEPVELITNGAPRVNDDQAVIIPQRGGFTSRYQLSIAVTKFKEKGAELWKVDLERTYVPTPQREQLMVMPAAEKAKYALEQRAIITAAMKKYRNAAEVFRAMAKDVRNKKFRSVDEVERELARRVAEVRDEKS